jgi:hypothetical protein
MTFSVSPFTVLASHLIVANFASHPDNGHVRRASSWTEVTGDPDFYLKLTRPMGDIPQRRKAEYRQTSDAAVNRLEGGFVQEFCTDGQTGREKLTRFVCGNGDEPTLDGEL